MTSISCRVFLKPRGFIRIIEIFLAMVAFATLLAYQSSVSFTMVCPDPLDPTKPPKAVFPQPMIIAMPFALYDDFVVYGDVCKFWGPEEDLWKTSTTINPSQTTKTPSTTTSRWPRPPDQFLRRLATEKHLAPVFLGDAPIFFVFFGFTVAIFSLFMVFFYLCIGDRYLTKWRVPVADFYISLLITAFWFVSSCALAKKVDDIKFYTGIEYLERDAIQLIPGCIGWFSGFQGFQCGFNEASYGPLNAAVVFGFLNFVLWAVNLFFIYRETHWYLDKQKNLTSNGFGLPETNSNNTTAGANDKRPNMYNPPPFTTALP